MDIQVDEIFEKEMLVVQPKYGKWKPDTNMLMHVASFEDHGAHHETIEEAKKDIIDAGDIPRRVKFRLMIHVEYLD